MRAFHGAELVTPEVNAIYDRLMKIWAADTCAPRMRGDWTPDNPTLGQCSITAFLVQDLLGGRVYGILRPDGNYHCYNVVDGMTFDLTSEQFGDEKLDYTDNPEQFREIHFAKEEKRQRYLLLKKRYDETLIHPFGPLYSKDSRVLILGSFPSVKSREQNFFYGHPQNRFWKVIAALFDAPVPQTIEEKKRLILDNGLALWDSIASCTITGSSDASIRNAKANDIGIILDGSRVGKIYCNGRKSHELYKKYIEPQTGRAAVCLPSTSPANAQWTLEKLIDAWSVVANSRKTADKDD